MKYYLKIFAMVILLLSCARKNSKTQENRTIFTGKAGEIQFIVLAPGHFHANLLQKSSLSQVNDSVFVYAPAEDAGLKQYLSAIESFNQRDNDPTNWQSIVYTGGDYLDKMIADGKGNVVILAGNNKEKTRNILRAAETGLNVLSDKPMAISRDDFLLLEEAYSKSKANDVLLYDMMTERYDILNIIERELINDYKLFGELQPGTPADPAVYMESVHHFYKEVSGAPLIRPAWYYDVEQQGEGIADVTTHLIDLLFWKCFPGQPIDYTRDIGNISSAHWPTEITLEQFAKSTEETAFPGYLQKYLCDSLLKVYANGALRFDVKGHYAEMKVLWNWQAPEGGADTFMSVVKGTKAVLKTVQNKEQNFVKQLYVQKPEEADEKAFSENLVKATGKLRANYPFVTVLPTSVKGEYLVNIPVENREGHETHFRHVAESFFNYLVRRDIPEWEKSNTLAKYFITTKAAEVANDGN